MHRSIDMALRGSFTIVHVRGIPIRAHWTLLLVLPYFGWMFATRFTQVAKAAGVPSDRVVLHPLLWGGLLAVGLFVSVLLHELAHSMVALRAGARVREITLMLLGGVSQIENLPRRPRTEAWMAAVGPLTSLALGGLLWLAYALCPSGSVDLRLGLFYLAEINFSLGIFNLLPAFPMDGGRVLRAALAGRLGPVRATDIAARVGQVLALALGALGVVGGNLLLMLIALFLYSGAQGEAAVEKARADLEGLHIGDLLMAHPPTVTLDTPLDEAGRLFHEAGRWELPAVGDRGEPAGVVRALDLASLPPEALLRLRVRDLGERLEASVALLPASEAATAALSTEAASILVVEPTAEGTSRVVGLLGRSDITNALAVRSAQRRIRPGRPPHAPPRDATVTG